MVCKSLELLFFFLPGLGRLLSRPFPKDVLVAPWLVVTCLGMSRAVKVIISAAGLLGPFPGLACLYNLESLMARAQL
jgi:hypothetical protein